MAKATCSIEGCERKARCRGWCDLHYNRWRAHGDPEKVLVRRRKPRRELADINVEAKVCSTCERRLPLDAFYRRKVTADGLMYRCKDCCRDAYNNRYRDDPGFRERRKRYHRTFYEAQWAREENRRAHGLRKYGLTVKEFDALAAAQGGRCAVCSQKPKEGDRKRNLAVDHEHATGRIRGLLCDACNIGLGMFRDDPRRLRAAIAYLKRTATATEPLAEVVGLW